MTVRLAINGYGRIGRSVLREIFNNEMTDKFKIVAIILFV